MTQTEANVERWQRRSPTMDTAYVTTVATIGVATGCSTGTLLQNHRRPGMGGIPTPIRAGMSGQVATG